MFSEKTLSAMQSKQYENIIIQKGWGSNILNKCNKIYE